MILKGLKEWHVLSLVVLGPSGRCDVEGAHRYIGRGRMGIEKHSHDRRCRDTGDMCNAKMIYENQGRDKDRVGKGQCKWRN